MFVRIKTTPNSPRRSVQLVEGVRDGGKIRQRIVRHIGVAMDEDELERPGQLGEYVKAKLTSLQDYPTLAEHPLQVGRGDPIRAVMAVCGLCGRRQSAIYRSEPVIRATDSGLGRSVGSPWTSLSGPCPSPRQPSARRGRAVMPR